MFLLLHSHIPFGVGTFCPPCRCHWLLAVVYTSHYTSPSPPPPPKYQLWYHHPPVRTYIDCDLTIHKIGNCLEKLEDTCQGSKAKKKSSMPFKRPQKRPERTSSAYPGPGSHGFISYHF